MKKTVFRRILSACLMAAIICSVVCAALFERSQYNTVKKDMGQLLRVAALTFDSANNQQAQAAALSQAAGGARVTYIAPDGTVLGDTEADPAEMGNHLDRSEIVEAQSGGVGVSTRRSATLGQRQMYVAIRLSEGGFLRISTAYGGMLQGLIALLPGLAAAVFLSLLAALWFSSRFSDTVSKPLVEMADTLKLVRGGGVQLDPDSYRYEELSEMAGDINHLSREVSSTLHTLQQEQDKIAYLLDNMSEGLLLLDNMENVLIINQSACNAFGCNKESLSKNVVHATRNIPFLEAVSAVMEKGETRTVDLLQANGTVWQAALSPVKNNTVEGITGGVIVVLSNVTPQRVSQKMRRDFFSTASHELKTPLTSIKGFSELLTNNVNLSEEEKQDFLRRIAKEADTMTQLVNDIIMISRLEAGDISFEREIVDFSEVVTEACDAAKAAARQNDITLNCRTDKTLLSASRRDLRELANNLIQNAVKYNVSGGSVDVALENNGTGFLLRVHNTGEAIPPEDQPRIFERFYRVDKGRARSTGGTGLGLAIVKHVASQYGALVSLHSTEADGTTFEVRFPPQ